MSLLYPASGIDGYPREAFIDDLLREHEADIRRCLQAGAHNVQVDFTEGRLAMKLDPSGQLLESFVDLNNRVLDRFSADERRLNGLAVVSDHIPSSVHHWKKNKDYAIIGLVLDQLKMRCVVVAEPRGLDR